MRTTLIASAASAMLVAAPAQAAELLDDKLAGPVVSNATAGAYLRIPLGRAAQATPRAGLRLAMSHSSRDPRTFSTLREANLLDMRFTRTETASLYIAGHPVSGSQADRMNAAGQSKGRLDKIMIGAGIALGAVAAFFLVSSVAD